VFIALAESFAFYSGVISVTPRIGRSHPLEITPPTPDATSLDEPTQPPPRKGFFIGTLSRRLSFGFVGRFRTPPNCMRSLTLIALALIQNCLVYAASFVGLGDLPGGDYSSAAYGVSTDGTTVVGYGTSASGREGFKWTPFGGVVGLGDLPGGAFASPATGVSGDGSIVVGGSPSTGVTGNEAYRWTLETGIVGLGDFPGGLFGSNALAISGDGSTIVGIGSTSSDSESFRYNTTTGLVSIGGLVGRALSFDGGVVVGEQRKGSDTEAYRWTDATGRVGLGDLPGGSFYSVAHGVSLDGSVVVGQGAPVGGGSEAFRWTLATGMVGLGDLPGGMSYSYAYGVSGDGESIVGVGFTANGNEAFIWDSTHGMRNLQAVLIAEYGVTNLGGWTLSSARAISADGSTIVGDGINPSGQMEAWRVTGIPEPHGALFLFAGSSILFRRFRPHQRNG
jgi:probable HAF family extracellular repeat protein